MRRSLFSLLLLSLLLLTLLPPAPCAQADGDAPGAAPARSALPVSPAPPSVLYDCNDNGVEDAVDIALGTSVDANENAIPDECEDPRPGPTPSDFGPGVR